MGFIGSKIIEQLEDQNEIISFDLVSRDNPILNSHPNVRVIEGNVLDLERLTQILTDGVNIVIHCAAITGIDTVIQKPISTIRVNLIGSANVFEAAAKVNQCERIISFSSSEVFGQHSLLSTENEKFSIGQIGETRWAYSVSKLATEHLAMAYFKEHHLPVTILRPFNVYGPGQIGASAMRSFILRALNNENLEIHGDGTQIRAWCYIDDMVDATLLALEDPKAVGESFNIGNQRAVVTIYGLANVVIRVLNSASKIVFTKKDYEDVELRIPAISKARELLGFEAKIELEEGIARTADYYRIHNKQPQ